MKRKIVALTGGIGSGKSAVGNILREMGYAVLDCDEISREVEKFPTVWQGVTDLLGKGYVENGQLLRAKIRERIFADEELHKQYSALFWNRIGKELKYRIMRAPALVFVEIAVLDAFEFDFTEIWQVESTEENRINRVMKRDGVSAENVKSVMARQKQQRPPTKIIPNDGSLEELKKSVLQAVSQL